MYYFVRNLVEYIGYAHITVSSIVSSVVCNLLHLVAYGLQWYYMILNGTFSILADVWFDLFILAVVQTCMLLFAGLWVKETRVDTEYNKG